MNARKPTPDLFVNQPITVMDDVLAAKTDAQLVRSQLRYDYGQLGDIGPAIEEHAVAIKIHERKSNEAIIEAGRHLIAVKDSLPHGAWMDWLQVEFHMSDRTALTLMSIAERFDGKSEKIADLQNSVLGLLASPSVPEAAVDAVIDASATGKVSVEQAKEIIRQHKPTVSIGGTTPKNDLGDELTEALLRTYWSPDELEQFAKIDSPFDAVRRKIVQGSRGRAGGEWRIDGGYGDGKIKVWHVSLGREYFKRDCDAVFTRDRFAKMTVAMIERDAANAKRAPAPAPAAPSTDDWRPPGTGARLYAGSTPNANRAYAVAAGLVPVESGLSDSSTTGLPATIPADMAARGWELRQLGNSARYWCHNSNGPRATGVHDTPADAIAEAGTMQIDVKVAEEDDGIQTANMMWNCRTATGVLRNALEYWRSVPELVIRAKLNGPALAVSLTMKMPDGSWKEWTGADLDEVFGKADRSL